MLAVLSVKDVAHLQGERVHGKRLPDHLHAWVEAAMHRAVEDTAPDLGRISTGGSIQASKFITRTYVRSRRPSVVVVTGGCERNRTATRTAHHLHSGTLRSSASG